MLQGGEVGFDVAGGATISRSDPGKRPVGGGERECSPTFTGRPVAAQGSQAVM